MAIGHKSDLEKELGQLYDIRNRRIREERHMSIAAEEAKKDIKMLTVMFSDEIIDVKVALSESEFLEWDARSKRLLFHSGEVSQALEGARNEILIRVRPFLKELVIKAKEYYV